MRLTIAYIPSRSLTGIDQNHTRRRAWLEMNDDKVPNPLAYRFPMPWPTAEPKRLHWIAHSSELGDVCASAFFRPDSVRGARWPRRHYSTVGMSTPNVISDSKTELDAENRSNRRPRTAWSRLSCRYPKPVISPETERSSVTCWKGEPVMASEIDMPTDMRCYCRR